MGSDNKESKQKQYAMTRKSIKTTVGFIIVPRLGHQNNLWWEIRSPPIVKDEKKPNFVFSEKKLIQETKRLSTKIAAMRPRSKPLK